MATRKRVRKRKWTCPECDDTIHAPGRLAHDDVRGYCLPCSEATGYLVARACPALERERAEKQDRVKARRRKTREEQAQARSLEKDAMRRAKIRRENPDGIDLRKEAQRIGRIVARRYRLPVRRLNREPRFFTGGTSSSAGSMVYTLTEILRDGPMVFPQPIDLSEIAEEVWGFAPIIGNFTRSTWAWRQRMEVELNSRLRAGWRPGDPTCDVDVDEDGPHAGEIFLRRMRLECAPLVARVLAGDEDAFSELREWENDNPHAANTLEERDGPIRRP